MPADPIGCIFKGLNWSPSSYLKGLEWDLLKNKTSRIQNGSHRLRSQLRGIYVRTDEILLCLAEHEVAANID
jgi:hypothetical protein